MGLLALLTIPGVAAQGKDPRAASVELMARDPKHELEGLGAPGTVR